MWTRAARWTTTEQPASAGDQSTSPERSPLSNTSGAGKPLPACLRTQGKNGTFCAASAWQSAAPTKPFAPVTSSFSIDPEPVALFRPPLYGICCSANPAAYHKTTCYIICPLLVQRQVLLFRNKSIREAYRPRIFYYP